MTASVELVYFSGCPNVEAARSNLRAAFADLGTDPGWCEWNLDDADVPDRVRGFASPSVLVAGRHVMGDEPSDCGANACSALGAPPASVIVTAVQKASSR
jgi:hypothetical protein